MCPCRHSSWPVYWNPTHQQASRVSDRHVFSAFNSCSRSVARLPLFTYSIYGSRSAPNPARQGMMSSTAQWSGSKPGSTAPISAPQRSLRRSPSVQTALSPVKATSGPTLASAAAEEVVHEEVHKLTVRCWPNPQSFLEYFMLAFLGELGAWIWASAPVPLERGCTCKHTSGPAVGVHTYASGSVW